MKILVSFILSTIMLNLSVHAKSSKRNSQKLENDKERIKQKMEDYNYYPGFEKNPRPNSPNSLTEERIQTRD